MIQLPAVTLLCIATRDVEASGRALVYSCQGIQFATVKLVSPYRPADLPEWILWEYVTPFPSINEWNHEVFYNLWKYFSTDYCLLIHADGYIVTPDSWTDEFIQYDYCGSPWSLQCAYAIQGGRDQELSRVGNSVSIRSRKLCMLPTQLDIPWQTFNGDTNEDTQLSSHWWHKFKEQGCTKAPLELACKFGREEELPEHAGIEPFVFHKWTGSNHIYPHL